MAKFPIEGNVINNGLSVNASATSAVLACKHCATVSMEGEHSSTDIEMERVIVKTVSHLAELVHRW